MCETSHVVVDTGRGTTLLVGVLYYDNYTIIIIRVTD